MGCSPIDTSRIGIPNIDVHIRHRLAGVDIQVLNFKVEINSVRVLILLDVFPDHLSPDIVRPIGDLRSQDAAGISCKHSRLRSRRGVCVDTCLVMVDGLICLESRKVTAELFSLCTYSQLSTKMASSNADNYMYRG